MHLPGPPLPLAPPCSLPAYLKFSKPVLFTAWSLLCTGLLAWLSSPHFLHETPYKWREVLMGCGFLLMLFLIKYIAQTFK